MIISEQKATELLAAGKVVALPTETVYGLAANMSIDGAVKQIFTLKGRPQNNPLIIHIAALEQLDEYVLEYPKSFEQLAAAFWPGPLTIVLPTRKGKVPPRITAALPTAAFRMPADLQTRRLAAAVGPLVMPSANLSGKPSATCAQHVEADFGEALPIVDGGTCRSGLESTIIICSDVTALWTIIRQGALTVEAFEEVLGYKPEVVVSTAEKPLCPGLLWRHYAPKAKLKLSGAMPQRGTIVGFEGREYPSSCRLYLLGNLDTPDTIAANLYACLRQLDTDAISEAWVDTAFPHCGILATVAERLTKAATSSH